MPVQPCQREGEEGHKYGESGKCYTGQGSQKKAAEQGQAIRASGYTGDEGRQEELRNAMDAGTAMLRDRMAQENDRRYQ